jgi:catechol 2,3-dioxygenase-like lactoylglutathione lyase family enzyme
VLRVTLQSFEVGIVSGDRGLVDFLADVFQLDEAPARESRVGTLHRLQSPGAVIKVMVPKEPPADADRQPFLAVRGLRYLTMSVTDLDQVMQRCVAHGGTVVLEALQLEPGTRLAVIADPDGNTIEITETA